MKNRYQQGVTSSQTRTRRGRWSGFSLIELLVALAVFAIIGGAAASMFRQHVPVFVNQQSQVALNFSLRNAVTQLETDASNAGEGFYQAADTTGWPLGITVLNQTYSTIAPHCWDSTTFVYSASCFDTLNIIVMDRNTAAHPSTSTGTPVLTSATSVYLTPVAATTPAQLALLYKKNDQILFLDSTGTTMTTARLTADATTATILGITYVLLQHGATKAGPSPPGTNDPCLIPSTCNDPYSISTNADPVGLQAQFDIADWVLKLVPITYRVDTTTDPYSPKLTRSQVATSTQAASTDVIADQIIGFKVGVSLYNQAILSDDPYIYSVPSLHEFTKVRAVRISLISRTQPNPLNTLRNTFDGGPYKIEAASVVVNPRSLSMKD
jgi:prepilin-type N-terminal cleavage/methylation domain-containing protein